MMLRDYQQRAIDHLYHWFRKHETGHPCLVLPTGSGKSHVIAALCKDALQAWPETRILMLTHVKELIEQNAEKMRQHWPDAPMGVYSASIGQRDLSQPITFAGIQSVRTKAEQIGHTDLVLIDECHLVSHKDEGGYRTLLADLEAMNPSLRVIGLTATPYRLGHGLITDKPALFDDLIEPVSIEELVRREYLAPLRSKVTKAKLDTSGVKKRGGEYIESELQRAVNTDDQNAAVVDEVIRLAGDRRSWLFFCAGVDHAQAVCDALQARSINAACVTGATPKRDRETILERFKAGELRALTNANVLTTGFDAPNIDLIAMMRPTMSPSLYVQMAGRGMRIKSHTDHCLVLDFAGVVATHGPITAVVPPKKAGDGQGEAPVKVCEHCDEVVHASVKVCPACGAAFPASASKPLKLSGLDIMGLEADEMDVREWHWVEHVSRASGKAMLRVTYYGMLSDPPVTEYLTVLHGGDVGARALAKLMMIAQRARIDVTKMQSGGCFEVAKLLQAGTPPARIRYRRNGNFYDVIERTWG
jgi:DNA repair protein RadD